MTYDLYIADIHYQFSCSEPLPLKQSDLEFLKQVTKSRRTIFVEISFVHEFSEKLIPDNLISKSLGEGSLADQPRSYYAVFLPGRPEYMHSYKRKNKIILEYLTESEVWNNPNFAIWNHLYLEECLIEQDAFLLHSCYTEYKGRTILFTAPSGTGKTTQAEFWKKLYGSRIINGDMVVVQCRDGRWYANGFPHHGSAEECLNESYPLEAIFILRQGKKNQIKKLSQFEKIEALYSETIINRRRQQDAFSALDLISRLTEQVRVEMECCEFSESAAVYAYQYLYEKKRADDLSQ